MEFFQVDIGLAPGGRYEGIALGSALAAPVEPPAADAFTVLLTAFGAEDYRSITTEAKLRLVHGSVAYADGADIYVVEAGTDITMEDATVAGAVIGASSGFLSLFPGSYDIVITVNDEVTMMDVEVLRINGVALAGGGIYSAVAIDDLGAMGMLDIIGIDDLAP